ncbi:hypothetical protein ACFPU0_04865 [Pseudomonas sp. GCM10022186]|uniref:hypothetical protein n=1 Tax=Pseudomonas sp. GCM10022186 TaxID=3252650 RepID=UPI0036188173
MFKSISRRKFETYFYGRSPYVKQFTTETKWYSFESEDITLLAVILFCHIDKDYNAIVLARDLNKRFRPVNVQSSLPSIDEAIQKASEHIQKIVDSAVNGLIAQGDEEESPFSIFAAKVPEHKRNRYLKMLLNDPTYYPARVTMEELAHWFEDPDGIFIRGLQGNEFNSRLFELYLQAAFYELDFLIDHSHPQPDYLLSKGGMVVAVEAATVAELEGEEERVEKRLDEGAIAAVLEHVENEMPFKFQRTLAKKVRHKPEPLKVPYWELPHTKGHPFVIAVHDYSMGLSMAASQGALQKLLYGLELVDGKMVPIERHEHNGRTISSNFFAQAGNRHVSAVMLVTGATIPKFNRMGRLAGIRSKTSMAKVSGLRTDAQGVIQPFKAVVEDPRYHEAWHDGIFMFHNPNAAIPLEPELFHRVIHCFRDGDNLKEYFPPNYMVGSVTEMFRFKESQAEELWGQFDLVLEKLNLPVEE